MTKAFLFFLASFLAFGVASSARGIHLEDQINHQQITLTLNNDEGIARNLWQVFETSPLSQMIEGGYQVGAALSLVQVGDQTELRMIVPGPAVEPHLQLRYGLPIPVAADSAMIRQLGGAFGTLHRLMNLSKAPGVNHYGDAAHWGGI